MSDKRFGKADNSQSPFGRAADKKSSSGRLGSRFGRSKEQTKTDHIHVMSAFNEWASFSLDKLQHPLLFMNGFESYAAATSDLIQYLEQNEQLQNAVINSLDAHWYSNVNYVGAAILVDYTTTTRTQLKSYRAVQLPRHLEPDYDLADEYVSLFEDDEEAAGDQEITVSLRDNFGLPSPQRQSNLLVSQDGLLVWNILTRTAAGALLGSSRINLSVLNLSRRLISNDERLLDLVRSGSHRKEQL